MFKITGTKILPSLNVFLDGESSYSFLKTMLYCRKIFSQLILYVLINVFKTLMEQMRLLKDVLNAQPTPAIETNGDSTPNGDPKSIIECGSISRPASISEPPEFEKDPEIIGLKALISSKNERIATLRTVLKANKQTAEAGKALKDRVGVRIP